MASREIVSEEQRIGVLERIAPRMVRYFKDRFERDEFVNEAWLRKSVRNADQEHKVAKAGKFAMIDYARQQLHRNCKNPENLTDDPKYRHIWPLVEDVIPDTWMDFDVMTSGLSRTMKLTLKLRADWFSNREIAKIIGVPESLISANIKTLRKDQKLRKCVS